jgi:hypothetical protein
LEERSVHVVDTPRSSALVKIINVLRAKIKAIAQLLFYPRKSEVGSVGLCCQSVAATHGIKAPD